MVILSYANAKQQICEILKTFLTWAMWAMNIWDVLNVAAVEGGIIVNDLEVQ